MPHILRLYMHAYSIILNPLFLVPTYIDEMLWYLVAETGDKGA